MPVRETVATANGNSKRN